MATRQLASRLGYAGSQLALENDPRFSSGGGSGGGGGGLTPTAVQTANVQATAGQLVLVNAANGSVQVTAPANPAAGTTFAVKRLDATTTSLTVVASGAGVLIDGDSSLTVAGLGSGATLIYDGSGWQISATAIVGAGTMDAASALTAPIYVVGNWFDRRSSMPGNPTVLGNNTMTANRCYYVAFFAHRQLNIDTLALIVGATAPTSGATARIGLYAMNPATGAPTGATKFDSGALSLGTAANATITQAFTATLPKGWSFFAVAFGATTPGSLYSVTGPGQAAPIIGASAPNTDYLHAAYWSETISGGVLPTTATPTPVIGNVATPDVFFRAAA